jgi:hypothetical protein
MLKLILLALSLIIEPSDAGTSFIRWGRTVCPTGSRLLFKGYMAGKDINKTGSGGNILCAHEDPRFVRGVPGRALGYSGALRGFELHLEAAHANLFSNQNVPDGNLIGQDLPCVVCYVAEATDKLVITGRPDCGTTGYNLMYSGFLTSEAEWEGRQAGEYVCLDESPEGRVGGSAADTNAVLYPVEVRCGSLPCNPYIDGMEVTCAVCMHYSC